MERCSISFGLRTCKSKPQWDSIPLGFIILKKKEKISVGDNVEKLEASYTAGGDVKWCSKCHENFYYSAVRAVPQKVTVNIELSYDAVILFLSICPRELKTYVYIKTCTQMLIAAVCIMVVVNTTHMPINCWINTM